MDKGVVEKCQALTTDNKSFSFSLTMGSDIFNFSSKKLVKSSCEKKKSRPVSWGERNGGDKGERVLKKTLRKCLPNHSDQVKCNQCDTKFDSKEELIAHMTYSTA